MATASAQKTWNHHDSMFPGFSRSLGNVARPRIGYHARRLPVACTTMGDRNDPVRRYTQTKMTADMNDARGKAGSSSAKTAEQKTTARNQPKRRSHAR